MYYMMYPSFVVIDIQLGLKALNSIAQGNALGFVGVYLRAL